MNGNHSGLSIELLIECQNYESDSTEKLVDI